MDKIKTLVVASFFLLGLLTGWVMGFHTGKHEGRSKTEDFEEGGGI